MRVVVVHNYYQNPGGEDVVFSDECQLLRDHGDAVATFTRHNRDLERYGRLNVAVSTFWNRAVCRELQAVIRSHQADVVHFHNTFPWISPAAYYAARRAGAAVVQTLHNYRLLCPGALLVRGGRPCETCLGRLVALPGIRHRCYRSNLLASSASAGMVALHRALGTWRDAVDEYIAPSHCCRNKYIAGDLIPAERITVKPHCIISDPGPGRGCGGYALFVGRLSPEKGVGTLLQAWSGTAIGVPLWIIGDGPLAPQVREATARFPSIRWLGWKDPKETFAAMGEAAFLVAPSEWHETFGKVVIEAFARATPVLTSDMGAIAELVQEGRCGLHFRAGDPEDLARKAIDLLHDPGQLGQMRWNARREFETHYTPASNYPQLRRIYQAALDRRHARVQPQPAVSPET